MNYQKMVVTTTMVSLASTLLMVNNATADEVNVTKTSNGLVEFYPSDEVTGPVDPTDPTNPGTPIDPTNPGGEPEPGTPGPLSIDFASSFDFGKNKITNKNETYYARAQKFANNEDRPNYVQISDNRGSNAGWTLKVKQNGDFKAVSETLNDTLTGAVISLTQPVANSNSIGTNSPDVNDIVLNVDGSEQLAMSAKEKAGAGTWVNYWGAVETMTEKDEEGVDQEVAVTKAVNLSVPGSTPKDAVKYQTKLTWLLSDVPGK